jgi:hypothetical protein
MSTIDAYPADQAFPLARVTILGDITMPAASAAPVVDADEPEQASTERELVI